MPSRDRQRERGYPSGTGDVGQVKHAGRVGQGIVEVADDKRILVPRLVGDAVGSPLDGDLPAATGDAGEERHGEPPDAEYEGTKIRHAVLVARSAVNLVAEICGSHVRCLRKGHPRVEILQFSREDFHEPRHEGEHVGRWRWFKVRAARRRSRSSLDPGKRLLLQWHTLPFR